MAATYQFALVDTKYIEINLVIYHPISQVSNFILITLIKHWPNVDYGFCPMNDN